MPKAHMQSVVGVRVMMMDREYLGVHDGGIIPSGQSDVN
jgi:hypothetical protein